MSQPFNKEHLSYLQQLMTNRNKSLRHEVSDHLDNALPVKKLKGGDPGQVATTDADGNVGWGDLPGTYVASMYAANSGSPTHTNNGDWQKVGSGGGTLTWISEIDKRPSGVSAQVDTSTNKRIDIRKTGLYRVNFSVLFSTITSKKLVYASVYKNGTQAAVAISIPGGTDAVQALGTRILSLAAGDYLELWAYQNDSASEAYQVAQSYYVFLQAEYLGPAS